MADPYTTLSGEADGDGVYNPFLEAVECQKPVEFGISEASHAQAAQLLLRGDEAEILRHVSGFKVNIAVAPGPIFFK